jgi:formylglycine-generating enzyme required for sulfatase activity
MKKNKVFWGMLAALTLVLLVGFPGLINGQTRDPVVGDQKRIAVAAIPSFNLRYVPATPDGGFQRDRTAANKTVINQGYWIAETEVTQELFQAVMGANPSFFDGSSGTDALLSHSTVPGETQAKRPVEKVSWYDAIAFCNKLSLKDGRTPAYSVSGISDWATLAYSAIPTRENYNWDSATINAGADGYRLPTEMQWMWAAMGATKGGTMVTTTGYDKGYAGSAEGSGQTNLGDYAWYNKNADNKTHEAGKKLANELGLFDMNGNVDELCWDWSGTYKTGTITNDTGEASGSARVIRGGSWMQVNSRSTVASRSSCSAGFKDVWVGFRFVCP